MTDFLRSLAVGLVLIAWCAGDAAAAEEAGRSPDAKSPPSASSKDKPRSKGIDCKHGIACPIISIPVPDVPLDTTTPVPSRP